MHVHQVFPYCYVPCAAGMEDLHGDPDAMQQLFHRLARQIDDALVSQQHENPADADVHTDGGGAMRGGGDNFAGGSSRQPQPQPQHRKASVVGISMVKGLPFYGYTAAPQSFLKIEICQPGSISRLAQLLQSGAFLDRPFQPFEAHIPYVLQVRKITDRAPICLEFLP
eukprot:SAG31_NODE_976_length_10618_cov_3.277118_4_plen_168_part_00